MIRNANERGNALVPYQREHREHGSAGNDRRGENTVNILFVFVSLNIPEVGSLKSKNENGIEKRN